MINPAVIAAELSLESQGLRAVLRVEVVSFHHAFLLESHLCDLRKNAEACLPDALATVAPPALRQILEEVGIRLTQTICSDLAFVYPSNQTPVAPASDNSSTDS